MTFTEYPELEQRSEEWFKQRRGLVTASAVGTLITPKTIKPAANPKSRALTEQLVAERISGWTDPTHMNDDMWRGVLEEDRAVSVYEEHYAPVTRSGFMTEDRFGFTIGYSPDGLVGSDGLIEVKCPRAKTHVQTVLADEVPEFNMAQVQCALLVTGREWIDFVSFVGGLPLYVKRVEPDQKWFDAIVDTVAGFEAAASKMVADWNDKVVGLPATERLELLPEARVA